MRKELQRDQGLSRLSKGTRWLTAGAVFSAGCLSVAVAETLPGRSSAALRKPPTPVTPASPVTPVSTVPPSSTVPPDPTTPAPASSDTTTPVTSPPQTLAPPTTPPTTAYNPPVVSSGGS